MSRILRFTSPMQVADVGRAEQYRPIRLLLAGFEYRVGADDSRDRIVVPPGFCCDGVSVPWLFRWLIQPWGIYAQAAILHDFLYATRLRERRAADDILFEAIVVLRCELDATRAEKSSSDDETLRGKLAAWIAWIGVRLGGYRAWRDGTETFRKRALQARGRLRERGFDKLADLVIVDIPEKGRAMQPGVSS